RWGSLPPQGKSEASHGTHLAERIRTMRDEGWELEDVILAYEEPLIQVAAAADMSADLDRGVAPIAADVVAYIEDLREQQLEQQLDLETSRARIVELEDEIRELDERLGGVSQERVALIQRIEAEERVRQQFETVERMFERDEARVSREGNEIVLRMVGLTRSEEHTSELQSRENLVCRLLLEKKTS